MSSVQTGAPTPLHVLEVVGNGIVGGMETYVLRLLEFAPRTQFRFSILCPFESAFSARARALGASVHTVQMPDVLDWHAIDNAVAWVNSEEVQVLHAHLANAHALAGVVGKLTQRPVLATVHSRQLTVLDIEAHRIAGTQISVVCRYSHLHALSLGVPGTHLHLINNGVDCDRFQPAQLAQSALQWRRAHGLPEDVPLVGFVGRLSWEKGPELFVRSALLVHAVLPHVQFVLIGAGPMRKMLEEGIEQAHLARHVHFVGAIEDMCAAYNALDVMVSTSHTEAMPLAVLEAMACAVPVVATAIGGVSELVVPEQTGQLVAPNDCQGFAHAIGELIRSPERRARMGTAARERVLTHFTLTDSMNAMLATLQQLALPSKRRVSSLSAATSAELGDSVTALPTRNIDTASL